MGQTIWLHKKTGGKYVIVTDAVVESNLDAVVVYKSIDDGKAWVRPYHEFHDGRFERTKEQLEVPAFSFEEAIRLIAHGAHGFSFKGRYGFTFRALLDSNMKILVSEVSA